MNTLMQMAGFWARSGDDAAIGGAPLADAGSDEPASEAGEPALDLSALAEAAYEGLGTEEADAETEDEEAEESAEKGDEDEPSGPIEGDPLALDAAFAEANPERAQAYGEQLTQLRQSQEALAPVLALEEAFADPSRAAATLKGFAEALAHHHGFDLAEAFGQVAAGPSTEGPDWHRAGYGTPEAYAAAPDYERAGYDSPGEYRLAQQLEQMQAKLTPFLAQQEKVQAAAQAAETRSRFESAVKAAAPNAIAAVKMQHGWVPSEAQALQAAARFPQLAAQDLGAAILAAHPVELAKHYAAKAARTSPKMPELVQGGERSGVRVPDPDTASIGDLAEFAYSQIG